MQHWWESWFYKQISSFWFQKLPKLFCGTFYLLVVLILWLSVWWKLTKKLMLILPDEPLTPCWFFFIFCTCLHLIPSPMYAATRRPCFFPPLASDATTRGGQNPKLLHVIFPAWPFFCRAKSLQPWKRGPGGLGKHGLGNFATNLAMPNLELQLDKKTAGCNLSYITAKLHYSRL
jgi:hypothetical protein